MIKKIWHDPVGSNVIAGAITWAIGSAFAWGSQRFHFWSTGLQPWLIGLLAGIFVLILMAAVRRTPTQIQPESGPPPIAPKKELPKVAQPDWRSYMTDTFYQMRWRWQYGSRGIWNLACFCPRCDYQLSIRDVSSVYGMDILAFHCEDCGREITRINESLNVIEDRVARFIQQKLRNDSWHASTPIES